MGNTQYILLGVIVVIAVLSWRLLNVAEIDEARRQAAVHHIPDFYLDDFTATNMDAAGQPRYRLQGQHLEHYPDDGRKTVTDPRMTWFRPDLPPWIATADQAVITQNDTLVELNGQVTMHRDASAQERALTLVTRDLRIEPQRQYAETRADVLISSAGDQVRATGMQVYLKEGRIDLLANVRGTYAPTHR